MDVLSRNSCVTAMPMEAKASEVRSQARKVRSATPPGWGGREGQDESTGGGSGTGWDRGSEQDSGGWDGGAARIWVGWIGWTESYILHTQSEVISRHAALVVEFDTAVLLHNHLPPLILRLARLRAHVVALGGCGGLGRSLPLAVGAGGGGCLPLASIYAREAPVRIASSDDGRRMLRAVVFGAPAVLADYRRDVVGRRVGCAPVR